MAAVAAVRASPPGRQQHALPGPRRSRRLPAPGIVEPSRHGAPALRGPGAGLRASGPARGDVRRSLEVPGLHARSGRLGRPGRHQGLRPLQRPLHRAARRDPSGSGCARFVATPAGSCPTQMPPPGGKPEVGRMRSLREELAAILDFRRAEGRKHAVASNPDQQGAGRRRQAHPRRQPQRRGPPLDRRHGQARHRHAAGRPRLRRRSQLPRDHIGPRSHQAAKHRCRRASRRHGQLPPRAPDRRGSEKWRNTELTTTPARAGSPASRACGKTFKKKTSSREIAYVITSLGPGEASPKRLPELNRGRRGVENPDHRSRAKPLRMPDAGPALADSAPETAIAHPLRRFSPSSAVPETCRIRACRPKLCRELRPPAPEAEAIQWMGIP